MGVRDPVKEHAKWLFSHLRTPWPDEDRWSVHTRASIADFLSKHTTGDQAAVLRVLNVGSHGNPYGLSPEWHFHVDIAETPLRGIPLSCVSDAESLPFSNDVFDLVLCVGSVINYCAAAQVIRELARVLKPGGKLLLEFESSDSLEFAFTREMSKDVTLVTTFHNGAFEKIYVYGRQYILSALRANGLSIGEWLPFHVLSPFAYFALKSVRLASRFASLDRVARRLPIVGRYSANVLVSAHKLKEES